MSPGIYLRKRREAAGLGVIQAAANLAALAGSAERDELALRITAAEEDRLAFTHSQAALLRDVFAFDVDVYADLLAIAKSGRGAVYVPPRLCRECACSWHDPCPGGCAWAEPDLCSACVSKAARPADTLHRWSAAA